MMDWADEIESNIAAAYAEHGAILAADGDGMISKALRKAKADGIREAADLLPMKVADSKPLHVDRFIHFISGVRHAQEQGIKALIDRANQIEKGE